jgi:oligoendopeptidase F
VTTAVESGAQGVRWDLTPLAPSEQAMKERLGAAVADAAAFVERWSAKSLEMLEPTSLRALLRELADIRAARDEAKQWAFMLTQTDSENPAVLDIRAWVDNRLPHLKDAIRHFELAWMALPDDRVRLLAEDEAVARDPHFLLSVRRFRPFLLSAAEERALSARDASAGTAWQTLRDRTLGAVSADFDDGTGVREWPLSELESARRAHPDRDVRRRAQEDDDCALRTRSARDRTLLRLARRRSACRRPPAWPRRPHGASEPREPDRRRRGRGAARRVRGARRDRTPVVPPEGGAARP